LLERYRATGADPPFGDPRRAHGVAMEGHYWRLTDPAAGRVVVALVAVCRAPDGPWAMVTLAAHPGGFVRTVITPSAAADPRGFGVVAGPATGVADQRGFATGDGPLAALRADAERLRVDLGPGARLDVRFTRPRAWPRRAFGGLGPAHAIPGLGQYWHPHLLGAGVAGEAELDGARVDLAGAHAYAEKNWGSRFAERWWWGQADAFAARDVCVAFAGGPLRLGPWAGAPTALVVRIGDEVVRLGPPAARVSSAMDHAWALRGRSARHAVELQGEAAGHPPHLLSVPVPAERRAEVRSRQLLAGRVVLSVRRGRRLVFAGESRLAGLERELHPPAPDGL